MTQTKPRDIREPRLVIAERLNRRDNLGGAWWPFTRSAGQELESLLRGITRRFHTVHGITLNFDEWPGIDVAVKFVGGHRTKVSWYGLPDRHLAVLHLDGARRINLLVIPPETSESTAISAMLLASTPGNSRAPDELLLDAVAHAAHT